MSSRVIPQLEEPHGGNIMRFLLATRQSRRWGLVRSTIAVPCGARVQLWPHYFIREGDATNLQNKIPKLNQALWQTVRAVRFVVYRVLTPPYDSCVSLLSKMKSVWPGTSPR